MKIEGLMPVHYAFRHDAIEALLTLNLTCYCPHEYSIFYDDTIYDMLFQPCNAA